MGVATDDIDIFTGEQGARCLDLSGREHGRAVRLLRTLEAAVGHEGETNHRIDEALHQGATLLSVKVHKERATRRLARSGSSRRSTRTRSITGEPGASKTCRRAPRRATSVRLPGERIMGENEHAVWMLDTPPGLARA